MKSDQRDRIVGIIITLSFWLSVALAYSKTAELLSIFSPHNFLGYTGIGWVYGYMAALLVEGIFVTMKYRLQQPQNDDARLWTIGLAVGTWGVSMLAQILDSYIYADFVPKVSGLPIEIQTALAFLIPAIPVLVMGAITLADAAHYSRGDSNSSVGRSYNRQMQFAQEMSPAPLLPPDQSERVLGRPVMSPQPRKAAGNGGNGQSQIKVMEVPAENEFPL